MLTLYYVLFLICHHSDFWMFSGIDERNKRCNIITADRSHRWFGLHIDKADLFLTANNQAFSQKIDGVKIKIKAKPVLRNRFLKRKSDSQWKLTRAIEDLKNDLEAAFAKVAEAFGDLMTLQDTFNTLKVYTLQANDVKKGCRELISHRRPGTWRLFRWRTATSWEKVWLRPYGRLTYYVGCAIAHYTR